MPGRGTDSIVEICEAVEDYLNDGAGDLGIVDVWYGDERAIPRTPAIGIVPGDKSRTLTETGSMTTNSFDVQITIYHSRLDNPNVTRKECDKLAEEVEAYLHDNKHMNDLVIFGYVQRIQAGVSTMNRVSMRATRLMWTAMTKGRI